MADERLVRTPTSTGNRTTFTFAGWVKQNNPAGTNQYVFGAFSNGNNSGYQNTINLSNNDDQAAYFQNTGGTVNSSYRTTALYRDAGNWLHILVAVDTTEGQGVDRTKIYINGARNKSLSITTLTAEGHQANFNSTVQHMIGNWPGLSTDILSQLFDVFWIDGQALTPDVFGFYKDGDGYQSSGTTNATDFRPGQWMPHAPSKIKKDINRRGGFGTNGFYLPMNDSSNPGADFHCTPNSIIKLKGEDLPQPRNGAPTTSDSYVSQLRPEIGTLGFDGAVKFDGTDDYLSIGDSSDWDIGTAAFTLEGWVLIHSNSVSYSGIFGMHTGSTQFQFRINNVGRIQFLQDFGGTRGNTADNDTSGQDLRDDTWHHVAMVRKSDSTWQLYVDGNLNYSGTGMTGNITGINEVALGRRVDTNSYYLNGFISNFRFVSGTAVYTSNFTPPTEPLTNITNTKLLCCNSSTSATASTVTPGTITANGGAFATRNELTGSILLAVPGILDKVDLVTNGTFDSNTTGWTASNAEISSVNGTLKVDDSENSGSWSSAFQVITTVAGRTYRLELDVLGGNDARFVGIYQGTYTANSGTAPTINVNGSGYSAPQTVATTFTATGTSISIMLTANNDGIVYFDNVRLYDASVPVDYSADIKGSGTNKTIAVSNNANIAVVPSYYGSAMAFDGTTDSFQYAVPNNDALFLQSNSFTMECWVYPNTSFTDDRYMIAILSGNSANSDGCYYLRIYNTYYQGIIVNSNTQYQTTGTVAYKSGQWTHVAYVRDGNEQRLYINGVCEAVTTHSVLPNVNNSSTLFIGSSWNGDNSINAQIQDVRIYNGVAKYKGGFDVPKPYTPVGIEEFRTTADTCKNNFVTMNSLNKNGCTLSNGNLTTADSTSNGGQIYSTMGSNTGKWYYEAHVTDVGAAAGTLIGINPLIRPSSNAQNRTAYRSSGDVYSDSSTVQTGTTYTTGDIIGVAWDADNKKLWFAKNGSWVYSGDPANGNNPAATYTNTETQGPSIQYDNGGQSQVTNLNFGQNPSFSGTITAGTNADGNGKGLFKYAPPSGFLALCEDNLPAPAIADPGKHFKTVLWTGDGNDGRGITGVGFQPDFVWIKGRTQTEWHNVYDVVRGAGKSLYPNDTYIEETVTDTFNSFDNNGFSIGYNSAYTAVFTNKSGTDYVAWCWKAGGAPVTNNDGSITTQVSANQTAGFSIVSYTGTGSAGTVGHGLGKAPSLIITKHRAGTSAGSVNWNVATSVVPGGYLELNTTAAFNSNADRYVTAGTNTNSFPGGYVHFNDSNRTYISYCWAEIEGYSKFGSYEGNGSTDGPFVYCGFKPAFVLTKCVDANDDWSIADSSRSPVNPTQNSLRPNSNSSEDSAADIDILSNGFKIRQGNSHRINFNGETFIFAAFAESPFQTANAK